MYETRTHSEKMFADSKIPSNLFNLPAQINQLFGIFFEKKALITCPLCLCTFTVRKEAMILSRKCVSCFLLYDV